MLMDMTSKHCERVYNVGRHKYPAGIFGIMHDS